ncbi:MAG: hypothetical protein ACRD03_05405, partial [Acidimicrobiales bacterium]
ARRRLGPGASATVDAPDRAIGQAGLDWFAGRHRADVSEDACRRAAPRPRRRPWRSEGTAKCSPS